MLVATRFSFRRLRFHSSSVVFRSVGNRMALKVLARYPSAIYSLIVSVVPFLLFVINLFGVFLQPQAHQIPIAPPPTTIQPGQKINNNTWLPPPNTKTMNSKKSLFLNFSVAFHPLFIPCFKTGYICLASRVEA